MRTFIQSISDYQHKVKKSIADLNERIDSVEEDLKIMRDYEKSECKEIVK